MSSLRGLEVKTSEAQPETPISSNTHGPNASVQDVFPRDIETYREVLALAGSLSRSHFQMIRFAFEKLHKFDPRSIAVENET